MGSLLGRLLPSFRAKLLAIALAGLVIRVVYVVFVAADMPKELTDRLYYHETANALAKGLGFIEPFLYVLMGRLEPSAGHPPMWTYVLTGSSLVGADTWVAHQLVGCVVGAAAIVVVGLLGRQVAGPRVGLLAAGLAAVYPTLIGADGSLMAESLYGLFVALALLVAYRLLHRPDPRAAALFGALVALAALTRAEGLLFLLLPGLVVCLRGRPWRWQGLRLVAISFVAAGLVIAPWTIRNWIVFDEPVLISLNDSTVLAGANCEPVYSGRDIGTWTIACLRNRDLTLNEVEQARIWRDDGVRYIREHADRLPAVVLARVARLWDLYQPRRQAFAAEGRDYTLQWIGTLIYFALLPLGVYGAILLRRHGGSLVILLSPAVVVTASSVIGYGLPRFRQPVELTLLVLAAIAIASIYVRERARFAEGAAEESRSERLVRQ